MILAIVAVCAVILIIAYHTYGRFLAGKALGLDDKNPVPSRELEDGVDFVPAKKSFLLGQHFSAIAAAGPINGPVQAAILFGWAPAIIWVLIGAVFIGGIHDMGSLVASVRNKAASISEIVRDNVSKRAWMLFMMFIWITLVYVVVAFTDTTSSSFVGEVVLENGDMVAGGAIASSSIMYLILPIIMGLLIKFTKLKEGLAVALFLPLVGLAIWGGKYIPVELPIADLLLQQKVWGVLILAYCLVAAMMPMWLLLQPRGALGGYFLYIVLAVGAVGVAFGGYEIQYPAFTEFSVSGGNGLYPALFITVACGAVSGFHALVSTGTSSRQLAKESDAKAVGYGAMLLEAMVAIVSIVCVMILASDSGMISKAPNFIYASGIGSFMELIGIPAVFGVSFGLMAFTTFVYDTLDVCTRLGRYIIEELTGWKDTKGMILGTALTAGVPIFFIFQTMTDTEGNVIPAWKTFWNTFGASNQLLAALALIGVGIWLYNAKPRSKVFLTALLPAVFMFITSNIALLIDIHAGWVLKTKHPAIPAISLILVILSLLVAYETVTVALKKRRRKVAALNPDS